VSAAGIAFHGTFSAQRNTTGVPGQSHDHCRRVTKALNLPTASPASARRTSIVSVAGVSLSGDPQLLDHHHDRPAGSEDHAHHRRQRRARTRRSAEPGQLTGGAGDFFITDVGFTGFDDGTVNVNVPDLDFTAQFKVELTQRHRRAHANFQ
jgi:hypothetical protein